MARRRSQDLVLTVSGNINQLDAAMKAARSVLNQFDGDASNLQQRVNEEFRKLGGDAAEQSARQITGAYDKMFRSIAANARAVTAETSQGGALQLLDAADVEEQSRALTQQAAAFRVVGDAAQKKALEEGEGAQSARLLATQSYAAAEAAEAQAREFNDTAAVLRSVRGEIDATGVSQTKLTKVGGQQRAAMQQLGFQLNDIATMYAIGARPSQIFATQIGQVTHALTLLDSKGNKFVQFLGGPWGIALGAAAVVLGPMIAKLFEGNDALTEAVKKLEEDAQQTEITRRAKEAFNATLEGQIALTREHTEALRENIQTQRQQLLADANRAQLAVESAQRDRARITAELDAARERLERAERRAGDPDDATGDEALRRTLAVNPARNEVARLEAELSRIEGQLAAAAREFRLAQEPLISDDIESAMDRRAAATRRFNDELGRLGNRLDIGPGNTGVVRVPGENGLFREVQVEGIGTIEYRRRRQALERQHRAQIEQIEREEREEERRRRQGERLTTTFLRPVDGGRVTGQFGEQRSGRRHGGVDFAVPVGTPVRAPAAGTIASAGARGDYGNLITIDFGGGTEARLAHLSRFAVAPGDIVEAGQVIGYSGGARGAPGAGNSTGPHLHYEVRQQGRTVNPLDGPFTIDPSEAADAAAELQERLAEEARDRQRRFEDQLGQAQAAQLDAWLDSAGSAEDRARIEEAIVAGERQARDAQIERQVIDGELEREMADQLLEVHHTTDAIEDENQARRERQDLLDRQLRAEQAAIDAQGTLLDLQLDFADTLDQRRRIARQLLALEFEERRRVAQRLLQSDDPDDRAAGELELARIASERPFRERQLSRDYADPLQSYFEQLRLGIADMDTALKDVAVGGLEGLEDGLLGIVTGTQSVADAFGNMAASILADLARIGIRMAIFNILGSFGGGGGGAIFDPMVSLKGTPFGFAGGGLLRGPGTGKSDSILLWGSNGEYMIQEEAVRQFGVPFFDALNAGRLPGFADGGPIDLGRVRAPSLPDLRTLRPANDAGMGGTLEIRLGAGLEAEWLDKAGAQAVQIVRVAQPGMVKAAVGEVGRVSRRRSL